MTRSGHVDALAFAVLKKKLQEGPLTMRLVSDSMAPLLKVGDLVEVQKCSQPIQLFDLVVFWTNEKLMCHFLWRDQLAYDGTFVTRSLKDPWHDDLPQPHENLLGVVSDRRISDWRKLWIQWSTKIRNSH